MVVRQVQQLTSEELRDELAGAISDRFGLSLTAFFEAVRSGALSREDEAVKEYMRLSKFLPDQDMPAECQSKK